MAKLPSDNEEKGSNMFGSNDINNDTVSDFVKDLYKNQNNELNYNDNTSVEGNYDHNDYGIETDIKQNDIIFNNNNNNNNDSRLTSNALNMHDIKTAKDNNGINKHQAIFEQLGGAPPISSTDIEIPEILIKQIIDMGFSRHDATSALKKSIGINNAPDVNIAMGYLVGDNDNINNEYIQMQMPFIDNGNDALNMYHQHTPVAPTSSPNEQKTFFGNSTIQNHTSESKNNNIDDPIYSQIFNNTNNDIDISLPTTSITNNNNNNNNNNNIDYNNGNDIKKQSLNNNNSNNNNSSINETTNETKVNELTTTMENNAFFTNICDENFGYRPTPFNTFDNLQDTNSLSNQNLNLKMVIIVRKDLKMSVGKVISQCCHGCVGIVTNILTTKTPLTNANEIFNLKKLLNEWSNNYGEKKIILQCNDETSLIKLHKQALNKNLPTYLVIDAGLTQIKSGSKTCLVIGPYPSTLIDEVTGKLELY